MLTLFTVALGESFEFVAHNGEVVTVDEPEPYQGKSLQERVSFDSVRISPYTFSKAIENSQSEDAVFTYLQDLGLPVEFGDASFVYYYRNRMKLEEFKLPKDSGSSRIVSVSYVYSKEDNDNYTFIFVEENGEWYLTDAIDSFGDICVITDTVGKNTWLIGYNGTTNRSVRWYHLQSTTVALAYLEHGVWADDPKYHVYVETHVELPDDSKISPETFITICKGVSVLELMDDTKSATAKREMVYTQINQYKITVQGAIELIQTSRQDATYNGILD
jgi:hypothetical protein